MDIRVSQTLAEKMNRKQMVVTIILILAGIFGGEGILILQQGVMYIIAIPSIIIMAAFCGLIRIARIATETNDYIFLATHKSIIRGMRTFGNWINVVLKGPSTEVFTLNMVLQAILLMTLFNNDLVLLSIVWLLFYLAIYHYAHKTGDFAAFLNAQENKNRVDSCH